MDILIPEMQNPVLPRQPEPPLLLRGPDGGETEDVRRAYFRDKE